MNEAQKHHAGQKKPDIKKYTLHTNPIFVKFYNRQNQFMVKEIRRVVASGWGTDWEEKEELSEVMEIF